MPKRPVVFVGSSGESEDVVHAIEELLSEDADIVPWRLAFTIGVPFSASLEKQLDTADFAIFVMAADDRTISRDKEVFTPRDNVILELGLFIGRLGVARCFCLVPASVRAIKLPSDLLGITTAKYREDHSGGLVAALGLAGNQFRARLGELRLRPKWTASTLAELQRSNDFIGDIVGSWWEFLIKPRISAIGFLTIRSEVGRINIQGNAYRADGIFAAEWHTISCGTSQDDRRLIYIWKGRYVDMPSDRFEGYGDFLFNVSPGPFKTGHGIFAEMNASNPTDAEKRTGELVRCTRDEVETMHSGDEGRISSLVRAKLSSWVRGSSHD